VRIWGDTLPALNSSCEENLLEWPYHVRYGREINVSADVLILGGGLAGCHAAINAAKKGAKVVVADKAPVIRSGSGGAGIDHWHDACTNPCCKISPDEMIEMGAWQNAMARPFASGHSGYIACRESWDTLLDIEKMGIKIRDVEDEFAGAEFRDEKTKLMFAYDYENRHTIRIQGANMKPALYNELKRLNVEMHDRVMVTSLLTEGGEQGGKVIVGGVAPLLDTLFGERVNWIPDQVGNDGEGDRPRIFGDRAANSSGFFAALRMTGGIGVGERWSGFRFSSE